MALSSSNLISLATLWMTAVSAGATRRRGSTWGSDNAGRNDVTMMLVKDLVSVPTYPNSLMRPQGRTSWTQLDADTTVDSTLHFDISEDCSGRVQFKMEVPGLFARDLNVELENDRVVRVRGSRNQYKQGHISRSEFDESIRLSDNVDVDHLQVNLSSSGILTITAPKKSPKMKRLPILSDDPEDDILNSRMDRRKDNVEREDRI